MSAEHDPQGEQRAILMQRRAYLDAVLAGSDERTIREQVGLLRSVMVTTAANEATLALAKQAFISVLGRYPAWAVREACGRFLDGRVGEGRFAPTPAEIAAVCRTLIAEHLVERANINAILDAEIYTVISEADREAMNARYAAHLAEAAKASKARDGRTTSAGTQAAERAAALRDLDAAQAKAKAAASEQVP